MHFPMCDEISNDLYDMHSCRGPRLYAMTSLPPLWARSSCPCKNNLRRLGYTNLAKCWAWYRHASGGTWSSPTAFPGCTRRIAVSKSVRVGSSSKLSWPKSSAWSFCRPAIQSSRCASFVSRSAPSISPKCSTQRFTSSSGVWHASPSLVMSPLWLLLCVFLYWMCLSPVAWLSVL